MAKLTTDDLANLQNETTVVNTINNNFAAVETAMENTLSRDGTSPNSMSASLDMNSNQILNLPDPVSEQEPATKSYVDDAIDLAVLEGDSVFTLDAVGAVTRTLHSKLSDIISVKDFGAIGDGTTNDTTGITSADAITDSKFVPAGTYDVTLAATDLDGPYWGLGQIRDSGENKRAPWFVAVKAAPSSEGNEDSVSTAFNGDLSKTLIQAECRVTGAATLGQPASGYKFTPEVYPFNLFVYNESGHNQSNTADDGRTAMAGFHQNMYHAGKGDAMAFMARVFVSGSQPSGTSWPANPSGAAFHASVTAGASNVNLNPFEVALDDGGFDVSGFGYVVNMDRSVATSSRGEYWAGFRAQSSGSQPGDVAFSAQGTFNFGIDFAHATLTNNAAVTLKADQRVYFNVTADAHVTNRFPSAVGDDYMVWSSSLSALNFVLNNSSAMQIAETKVTLPSQHLVFGQISTPATPASGLTALYAKSDDLLYMLNDSGAETQLALFTADLAALEALSTTGIAVRTGTSAWTTRTLTGPAAGISVSNGDGVSGNPTLALTNDLSALEGLGSTGLAVRSASDTWVQRSVAGTANEITVTNGDGVSGNPIISLPTAMTMTGKTLTAGTYSAIAALSTISSTAAVGNPASYLFKFGSNGTTVKYTTIDYDQTNDLGFIQAVHQGTAFKNLAMQRNGGGTTFGNPTGGFKGDGTVNAVAVYDDDTLLTDYVFDAYHGTLREGTPQRIVELYNKLDTSMFDPGIYANYWQEHRRLWGMPDFNDCIEGVVKNISLGGMIQLLWQTAEIQAIHISELLKRINKLEGTLHDRRN